MQLTVRAVRTGGTVKALVVAARARKIVDFMVFLEICLKFVFRLLYFDRFEICGKDFFFPLTIRFLSSDLLKRYEPYLSPT